MYINIKLPVVLLITHRINIIITCRNPLNLSMIHVEDNRMLSVGTRISGWTVFNLMVYRIK